MIYQSRPNLNIILASKSPRRQYLLKELGLNFDVITKEIDETFPKNLIQQEIPLYLCEQKSKAFTDLLTDDNVVITADTIVWINNHVLNKPKDKKEAIEMLNELSGNRHEVYTGVCLLTKKKTRIFYARTDVYFKKLSAAEIEYYIDYYKPYDKAGAYGAQEWIGYIGVEKIEGSYFNVMGLPVKELYQELMGL